MDKIDQKPLRVYETAQQVARLIEQSWIATDGDEGFVSQVLDEVVGLLALAGCRSANEYEDARCAAFARDIKAAESAAEPALARLVRGLDTLAGNELVNAQPEVFDSFISLCEHWCKVAGRVRQYRAGRASVSDDSAAVAPGPPPAGRCRRVVELVLEVRGSGGAS